MKRPGEVHDNAVRLVRRIFFGDISHNFKVIPLVYNRIMGDSRCYQSMVKKEGKYKRLTYVVSKSYRKAEES